MKLNKNFLLILFLILLTLVVRYLYEELLNTDNLYAASLAEQLTNEQINELTENQKKWRWLTYLFISIFLLLKICLISAAIDVGCFFFNKKIKYKKLFIIVTKAEFVFIGVIIVKILWFYLFKEDYTFNETQYFYPLSALNIVGYEDLQIWFIYPFQMLNLFEVIYWIVLASLLSKELNIMTEKSLSIVASSYGVGLLIWIIGIMFIMLNIN